MILFFYRSKDADHYPYFRALAERCGCPAKAFPLCLPGYRRFALLPSGWATEELAGELRRIAELRASEAPSSGRRRGAVALAWRRALSSARAAALYRYCREIIEAERPAAVCVWNGEKFYDSVAVRAAEDCGVPALRFENGVLPNSTTIDPRGINARNSVPRDPAFYRGYAEGGRPAPGRELVPRLPLRGRRLSSTARELPGRFLFLPFQVDHDTQIRHNSPWIRGMRHLFDEAGGALDACGDPSLHLVFREHPSTRALYPDLHARARAHGRIHFVNDRPLAEVVERSLAVATVNSTVGVEALLLGKKVVTLGDAFYNLPGLVLHAPSQEAFRRALAGELDRFEPDERLRRGFLAWLHGEYAVPGSWRRPDDAHWEAAARRVRELSGISPPPVRASFSGCVDESVQRGM